MATPAIVAAPERSPLQGGLFSHLTFRGDEDRWQTGVTFPGQSCGLLPVTLGPGCESDEDNPDDPSEEMFERELPWGEADTPFIVNGTFSCSPVGVTLEEAEANAVADLERHEEASVERVVWAGFEASDNVDSLVDNSVDAETAIGLLEHYIGVVYGAQGMIHVPRWLSSHLDLENRGQRLVTKHLRTPVVAGSGYGSPDLADTAIYATPAMVAYRSPAEIVGDTVESFDRRHNLVQVLAQRTYLLGFDTCPPASVQIDITL